MPLYEYKCSACNYSFEIKQSMNDKQKRKCPECKQTKLEKIIGTPMIFVKGEPQTIGHWAEKNTEKMGRYELEDKKQADGQKEKDNTERQLKKKIKSMTDKQKRDYIEKGKI